MSEPYIAEIRIFGFNFPPRGWAFCDGQILPIDQNQSLFSLLGTTYGGDGRTSFGLPELRGRVPAHVGDGITLGQGDGEESNLLSTDQMPAHSHTMQASTAEAENDEPDNTTVLADAEGRAIYRAADNLTALVNTSVTNTGSGDGVPNMQPFLTLSFCIALTGIFPPRN